MRPRFERDGAVVAHGEQIAPNDMDRLTGLLFAATDIPVVPVAGAAGTRATAIDDKNGGGLAAVLSDQGSFVYCRKKKANCPH